MHRYLIEVERYFSGMETFTVEAENKESAMAAATEYFNKHLSNGGNYIRKSLKVVKKLRPVKQK